MRAQTYTFDLILAISIMLVVLVALASFTFTKPSASPLREEALLLSQTIYNPFPHNWTQDTVVYPGFVQAHTLNTTLFTRFQALPEDTVRSLSGITSEYFVNISSLSLTAGVPPSIDASTVYSIKRFASYNGTIIAVEVLVWE